MASEDVGLADPGALPLAVAGMQTMHAIGMPEGALALAEVAILPSRSSQEQYHPNRLQRCGR